MATWHVAPLQHSGDSGRLVDNQLDELSKSEKLNFTLLPPNISERCCLEFFDEESNTYSKLLKKLSRHAKVAPQNVYKAFTNGIQQKLTFITRTTPKSEDLIEKGGPEIGRKNGIENHSPQVDIPNF